MENTIFTTARLVLRPTEESLAQMVCDYLKRNRDYLKPFEPVREEEYFSPAFQQRRLAAEAEAFQQGTSLLWWIFLKERPEQVIGSAHLSQIAKGAFCSCFLGYQIDETQRGKGLMPEALAPVICHAFEQRGLHRIEANVMPRNQASRRVLEKLEFEYEGRSRDYLRINGRWEDHLHFAKLNDKAQ